MDKWEEALALAREQLGELDATPTNLHAAAVGLVSLWYRNTDAVETDAHALGPWTDVDMLRNNALATAIAREALARVVDAQEDIGAAQAVLEGLLAQLAALLPTKKARHALLREKSGAPYVAKRWIEANGVGNWLALLVQSPLYPDRWWGAPRYGQLVDAYLHLNPGPPDPDTFRSRMVRAPWELTDEQASFVCDHRFDV